MIGLSAITVTVLFAVGVFLMLSTNVQRVAIGFLFLSNGVNLLVLTAGGLPEQAEPALMQESGGGAHVDPLPQAFILTAIVIGLGMAAFLLAMATRTHRETSSDEVDGDDDRP